MEIIAFDDSIDSSFRFISAHGSLVNISEWGVFFQLHFARNNFSTLEVIYN